jgi:hypothetical protein
MVNVPNLIQNSWIISSHFCISTDSEVPRQSLQARFLSEKYPFRLGDADVHDVLAKRYRGGAISVMEEE